MESKIKDLRQLIFKFNKDKSFSKSDFFVSDSNYFAYEIMMGWPKWEKNILNVYGEKNSGKSHLIDIFIKKFKGKKFESKHFDQSNYGNIKLQQNIILENFDKNINEEIIYSLIDHLEKHKGYLLLTSREPVNLINFKLNDLKSRLKNCLYAEIKKPDDLLIQALIVKNLSDYQITLDAKLINFICKRISRSYNKISEFVCTINEISLKKKKPINFKIIKEILET